MSTAIEWTDETWNPATGCDRTSPGCDNCYALKLAGRLKRMGQPNYQADGDPRTSGPGFGVTCHPHMLDQPLRWRRPRRVFVNSMSDLFHPDVPAEFIGDVFDVMGRCPQHTFQVLTKRPQRMRAVLEQWQEHGGMWRRSDLMWCGGGRWPLPNVWLGVSIESDAYSFRADHLRATPAAVRFVSAEPLLGPLPSLDLAGIDWLIVGGESGPGARPMHPDWARDLRDRCTPTLTAFHFKQWGGRTPKAGGRELDGRTWDEFPDVQSRPPTSSRWWRVDDRPEEAAQ
jgi:protein gp37